MDDDQNRDVCSLAAEGGKVTRVCRREVQANYYGYSEEGAIDSD